MTSESRPLVASTPKPMVPYSGIGRGQSNHTHTKPITSQKQGVTLNIFSFFFLYHIKSALESSSYEIVRSRASYHTDIIIFGCSKSIDSLPVIKFDLNGHEVLCSKKVKNLAAILDQDMSMFSFVSNPCKSLYFQVSCNYTNTINN